jgi:hypothetical protein
MRKNFYERVKGRSTVAHRRLQLDLVILGLLLFTAGCFAGSVLRWMALGAILAFLPVVWTHLGRVLDIEVVRDRMGLEPTSHGRHSGAHPRPPARNRG